jgi:hypothetical protein
MKLPTKFFLILLLIAAIFSCEKNAEHEGSINITCRSTDPINDFEWLKEYVSDFQQNDELAQYFYVAKGDYRLEEVIILGNCCPFCGTIMTVKTCAGTTIGYLHTDISMEEIRGFEIIFGGEACSF